MSPWKPIAVALVLIAGGVLFWRAYLVFAALLVVAVVTIYARTLWKRRQAIRNFRRAWLAQGRDLLLVYSNSPHWQSYVETKWLPRWGHRAVVLNWSERQSWQRERRPEVALFHEFAGDREYNPLAIVVAKQGHAAHVVRFWRAFREYKHGKERLLHGTEEELQSRLDAEDSTHDQASPR